jgi:integrase/recombinase XerD
MEYIVHPDTQLVDLWLSLKRSPHSRRAYRAEIDRLQAWNSKALSQITLADLAAYAEHLAAGGIAPASQNRSLTAVKSLLSFGHETGYLPFNPGAALKLRPARDRLAQRILSEQDTARLIAATPPGRNQVLLRLLYSSGLRVSELAAITWRDTEPRDAGAGQISVYGKGGRTRTILLPAGTWHALESLRQNSAPQDPVFRSRKTGKHLDPSQIRRIVYAAARRAGLAQRPSPHWMRHAHASHALDHGAPIHLVQATLGHASIATTGRYLHARPAASSALYLIDPAKNPARITADSDTILEE